MAGTTQIRTLLVVDDDTDFAESLADLLENERYRVITASDLASAQRALKDTPVEVALIDIRLDTESGIDLIATLKQQRPDLIAIMLTAHATVDNTIAALRQGAYDYLCKPLQPEHLLAALERAFERIDLKRKQASLTEQLAYQARHDTLTGLVNRYAFEQRLKQALASADRHRIEHTLCYIDLDQFKRVNDTCGHGAGDQLLRQLGALLQAGVRKQDCLARLGGDEFGLLFERCSLNQARQIAEQLRDAINNYRFFWRDKAFSVGASMGLVAINAASGDVDNILARADSACYTAKERGRNRIYHYRHGKTESALDHHKIPQAADIEDALSGNRLQLYYQSIQHLRSRPEGLHFELLLRLPGRNGQSLRPERFLQAAERHAMLGQLDRWVVDTAFDWFTQHPAIPQRLYRCHINLSGPSLGDQRLLGHIQTRLQRERLAPDKFCFEITETAAAINFGETLRFVDTLRALGCRFALDDFGRGLSSFTFLKILPVDYLKVDGSFVKRMTQDKVDLAIVKSVNDIAHAIGKTTIAEFAEDQATLDLLTELGADHAQGYAIDRPKALATLLPSVQESVGEHG